MEKIIEWSIDKKSNVAAALRELADSLETNPSAQSLLREVADAIAVS